MATTDLVRDGRAVRSTIALKMLMAVSGLVFIAFVLGHMYGNLKAFAGHDAFNEYAEHLREIGEPFLPHGGLLWILRVGLILAFAVHVYSAFALWARAKRARTTPYVMKKRTGATWASLLMRWGGVTLLLFIVWHLLNFTIGKVNVQGGPTDDPYNLLVDTFDVWWLTLIYLAAMADARRPPAPRVLERLPDPRLDRHRPRPPRGEDRRLHPGADHRRSASAWSRSPCSPASSRSEACHP